MKLKHAWLISGLMILALAVMFTGCEPNVPENNEGDNNELDNLQPGNNREREDEITEGGLNEHDNELGERDEFDENNVFEDNEDHLDDERVNGGTSAVEGDTSAADFDEMTYDEYTMSLSPLRLSSNNDTDANSNDFTHLPNKKIGWGLGKLVDEKNRPVDAVNANRDFGSLGATFIGEKEPILYLTFDEGYENGYTSSILDTLKEKRAKATFFVTYDYCKSVPELVQRMIDEGHTVGNHTYSHPSFPDCSVEEIREEIGKMHNYVKETFEYEMNLIRFPMGEFSERSLAVAQDMGYTSVFWSFAYMDFNVNNQPDPSASFEKIKSATHPGGIFLLHAVSKTNAEILDSVLNYWHSEGYRLGVIGEDDKGAAL